MPRKCLCCRKEILNTASYTGEYPSLREIDEVELEFKDWSHYLKVGDLKEGVKGEYCTEQKSEEDANDEPCVVLSFSICISCFLPKIKDVYHLSYEDLLKDKQKAGFSSETPMS